MVVDVIRAVAVIAVTLGAVSEFHIGEFGVGLAADGTLMDIALFLIDGLDGFFEIHSLFGMAMLVAFSAIADGIRKLDPEENEKVEDGHQGEKGIEEVSADQVPEDLPGKIGGVDPGKPFYLHGQDKHKQDLHIGEQNSKSKEHGQIHIVNRRKTNNETKKNVEDHAGEKEAVEPGGAPFPLQHAADPVIEISGNDRHEKRGAGNIEIADAKVSCYGDKNKSDQPPDLPPKNGRAEKE